MIGYVCLGTNDLERATRYYTALMAPLGASHAQVDAQYKLALELGGTDEGPAGARGEGFYAGYFRGLDGNKLCFCCFG